MHSDVVYRIFRLLRHSHEHEQERPGRLLRRLYRIARRSGADPKLRGQIMGFRTLIEFGA